MAALSHPRLKTCEHAKIHTQSIGQGSPLCTNHQQTVIFSYLLAKKKRPVSGAIQLEALSLALVGPIHLSEEIIQASDNII